MLSAILGLHQFHFLIKEHFCSRHSKMISFGMDVGKMFLVDLKLCENITNSDLKGFRNSGGRIAKYLPPVY